MHYALASECERRPGWKRCAHHGTWENVRYELEMKMLRTTRRHMWCYFAAMYYSDWKVSRKFVPDQSLRAHTQVKKGDAVVLFRKPYPHALAKTQTAGGNVSSHGVYTPAFFRINLDKCSTEEDKLAAVMSQNMSVFSKKHELLHPAEYTYDGVTPVPPHDYVCNGCGAVSNHFRADCETSCETITHRSLDKVRRPHGIPRSLLRRVAEDERGDAMKDDSGNYVVRHAPMKRRLPAPTPAPTPAPAPAPTPAPAPAPLDWTFSEHFCVHRGRVRHPDPVRVPESRVDDTIDMERHMDRLDAQARQHEQQFYANNPSKRRKRNSTCTHWLRGLCVKSALECEFMHNAAPEYMPVCKFYYDGECSNEDTCVFRHVNKPVPKKPCPDYVFGLCRKGPACHLDHIKRGEPRLPDWTACGFSPEEFRQALDYV